MRILRFLPRFYRLERELAILAEREQMTRAMVQQFQLGRLNELWAHARVHVPYYAHLAKNLNLPKRFGTLREYREQMPLLSKQLVRDQPDEFLSRQKRPGNWHRTGGSTGVPTAVYWEYAAHREMLRGKYRCEQSLGLDVFDKKVFLWGHSGSFAPGLQGIRQRIFQPFQDALRNRLRVSAYDLTEQQLVESLHRIRRFRAKSIYGYSSAIDLLAQAASRNSIELPSIRVAILTAEPADHHMLNRVRQNLQCMAVMEYGSVECGLTGYLMGDGTLRTRDDMVIVETLPTTDTSHEIVLTVLNNPSFPLMRYQIEDTTSRPWQTSESGFGLLADVQGRNNDMLVSKSGRRLHSMAVKHTLEHWPEIRRFTARQDRTGNMNVTLETSEPIDSALVKTLHHKLENMLDGFHVNLNMVDCIPGNLAGKHRWIISDYVPHSEPTTTSCDQR